MKHAFFLLVLLSITQISYGQQEQEWPDTHFDILWGANITASEKTGGTSLGGEWGVYMSHFFKGRNIGFSMGIGYSMINFAFDPGFSRPSDDVIRFKYLETPFTFIFRPLTKYPSIQMELGGSINIHQNSNTFGEWDNVLKALFSVQKNFFLSQNLSTAIGLKGRYYSINWDNYGSMATFSFFIKTGLQQ